MTINKRVLHKLLLKFKAKPTEPELPNSVWVSLCSLPHDRAKLLLSPDYRIRVVEADGWLCVLSAYEGGNAGVLTITHENSIVELVLDRIEYPKYARVFDSAAQKHASYYHRKIHAQVKSIAESQPLSIHITEELEGKPSKLALS